MGNTIKILILVSISFLIFFIWLRRRKIRKNKEKLEKIREDFKDGFQDNIEETPNEDEELLENLVEEIEKVAERGEKIVEFNIGEKNDLKIEAPDLLMLKTPRCNLHKSFSKIKFQKLEKSGENIELYLSYEES